MRPSTGLCENSSAVAVSRFGAGQRRYGEPGRAEAALQAEARWKGSPRADSGQRPGRVAPWCRSLHPGRGQTRQRRACGALAPAGGEDVDLLEHLRGEWAVWRVLPCACVNGSARNPSAFVRARALSCKAVGGLRVADDYNPPAPHASPVSAGTASERAKPGLYPRARPLG